MYKIFWPKFSICDPICHLYILCELICNILHNKIQIWTFDSDNKINLLQEFDYVLNFFSCGQIQHLIQILLPTSGILKDCAVSHVQGLSLVDLPNIHCQGNKE